MASGPTWRAGPPRRYDVALRPRGRTRVAHAGGAPWRGHVAGGHATTQVHVGARVGRHVSRSREEIVGQLIGESFPLFNRILPFYFFRVGLCSHTVLPLQDAWRHGGRRMRAERLRSRGPESTRSSIKARAQILI